MTLEEDKDYLTPAIEITTMVNNLYLKVNFLNSNQESKWYAICDREKPIEEQIEEMKVDEKVEVEEEQSSSCEFYSLKKKKRIRRKVQQLIQRKERQAARKKRKGKGPWYERRDVKRGKQNEEQKM